MTIRRQEWAADLGNYPPVPVCVAPSQTRRTFLAPPPAHMSIFAEGATILRLERSTPRWSEIDPILNSELDKLWRGEQPPKQVADSIKLLIDPLLKA